MEAVLPEFGGGAVDHAVALKAAVSGEGGGDDAQAQMGLAPGGGGGMGAMGLAFIADFDAIRAQGLESLAKRAGAGSVGFFQQCLALPGG